MKINPMTIDATLKIVDRLINAYERSCEIELEREKIAAELELGTKRIALEEKRLEAEFRAAMRLIDLREKELSARIGVLDKSVCMLEKQQQAVLGYCDRLMSCICETKDEHKREACQALFFQLHTSFLDKLDNSSNSLKCLTEDTRNLIGNSKRADRRLLSAQKLGNA